MIASTQIRNGFIILFCLIVGLNLAPAMADSGTSAGTPYTDTSLDTDLQAVRQALNALKFDEALVLFQEIESSEHPSVRLLHAFCSEFGVGAIIDANKARELALRAADAKDWEAAQFLAWQSITGHVGDPNLMESEQWRKQSIAWQSHRDHPPVLPDKILVPEKNSYVPRYELVNPWIQEKALEGDPIAQYNLYKTLIDGRSAFANVNSAMSWLQKSADGGLPLAAMMMAFYYEHGFILQQNPQMELKYLRIAAKAGNAEAQYKLGMRLLDRALNDKQVEAACEFIELAANQHHMQAAYELAELYYHGEQVPEDFERAHALYEIASALGHDDATYSLAWMASYGQGIPENKPDGIALFKKAVEQGSRSAAMRLSKVYLYGWGIEKDPQEAVDWANRAIEMGNDYGYRILGEIYYRGAFGEPDYAQAFLNYELAAREGDEDSQYMLGQMLFLGQGIERDLQESLTWYRLAAAKGHKRAQLKALRMEGFGWGTEQDLEKLVDLYRLQLATQEDRFERRADDMIQLLERRGWEAGSDEARLMEALRLRDDPEKQDFVREEYSWYKIKWFRDNIVLPIADADSAQVVEQYDEQELERLIKMELDQRDRANKTYPPKAVYQPAPAYPRGFRAFQVEETVNLMLVVDTDGHIRKHVCLQTPLPQFEQSIADILPYWRFIPGSQGNKPVVTRVRISIPFQIKSKNENQ